MPVTRNVPNNATTTRAAARANLLVIAGRSGQVRALETESAERFMARPSSEKQTDDDVRTVVHALNRLVCEGRINKCCRARIYLIVFRYVTICATSSSLTSDGGIGGMS